MFDSLNFKELIYKIVTEVRTEAMKVPKFRDSRNGAIRICASPKTKRADDCIGGLGVFDRVVLEDGCYSVNDTPYYEWTYSIMPGGSCTITGVWDGVKQTVNCFAFSALKIAHCMKAQEEGAGFRSGLKLKRSKYLTPDNGYGPYSGAIVFEIKDGEKNDFLYLYVCVSGVDSADDEKCAAAAIPVVSDFCVQAGLEVSYPTIS